MLDPLANRHPLALQAARVFTADKGYDSKALIVPLWDHYHIKPVMDIRNLWKDGRPPMSCSATRMSSLIMQGPYRVMIPALG